MKCSNTLLIAVFLQISFLNISATEVPKETAKRVAYNLYTERSPYSSLVPIIFSQEITLSQNNINWAYAFNICDNKGFIIISADDAAIPVIGYAFSGFFSTENTSPGFATYLQQVQTQMLYIIQNQISPSAEITQTWQHFLAQPFIPTSSLKSVAPLTTTLWGQGCYYNEFCPTDNGGPCGHVVTGCVATAMAQVMKYNNYPPIGSGFHSYQSNYGTLTAVFDTTYYIWDSMPNTLNSQSTTAQVRAVATLMSHCGIAVEMMYSAGASGAYSNDAKNAMIHYFNYSDSIQLLAKINYPDSVWHAILRNELDASRVMYYDGSGTAGHAFVCDGYQGPDYFHFNWGWNGSQNGYFYTTALNPGGMNFSTYQSVMINIKPATPHPCLGNQILTLPQGSFSDGSSYQSYTNNASCQWLIQPQAGTSINLQFFTFNTETGQDWVSVYDGSSITSPLLGTFSGNTLPPVLVSSGNTMLVKFTSNTNNPGKGWSASYQANFCKPNSVLTAVADTFEDGSGNFLYNDNTYCQWLIQPIAASKILLQFLDFKTEAGYDFVKIYDGTTTSAPLLGSYDGHNLPPPLFANSGSALVTFYSDGGVVDQGFKLRYQACKNNPIIYASALQFCPGDSVKIQASSGFSSYQWMLNGTLIVNSTDSVLYVKQPGQIMVKTQIPGCPLDSSNTLSLQQWSKPPVNIGNDTSICAGGLYFLQVNYAYPSYAWSNGLNNHLIIIDSSGVGLGTATYSVTVTDVNGCKNSDTINVTWVNCTGINIHTETDFQIFPNPTSDECYVVAKRCEPYTEFNIILSDLRNKSLYSFSLSKETPFYKINVAQFSPGIYFLHIRNQNSGFYTVKRIIVKR